MEFIFLFTVLPKTWFSTSTFQDFCSDLFCSYLQRNVRMFMNFCFSENLLVAAANRFKVLKILISLKITVYIQDHRLRSEKALDVQDFEWKSNCTEMAKCTYDFKHKKYSFEKRQCSSNKSACLNTQLTSVLKKYQK